MKARYRAQQIAQWFINRAAYSESMEYGEYLTNMKLQKLLYFAQGLSFSIFSKPLFTDDLQAWVHGPVVPDVYHKYKVCGSSPIREVVPVELDEDTEALLEYVYRTYGQYDAAKLRSISHEQAPYYNNYKEGIKNITIPTEDIKEEFIKNKKASEDFNNNRENLLDTAETCYINSIPDLKRRLLDNTDEFAEVDWKNEL